MNIVLAACSNKKAILVQELLQLHVGKTNHDTTNNKSFLMPGGLNKVRAVRYKESSKLGSNLRR